MIGKNRFIEIPQGIAFAGCKIANLKKRKNIMFNTLKNLVVTKTAKKSATRGAGLSKTQRTPLRSEPKRPPDRDHRFIVWLMRAKKTG